ncbi:hypothetical protein FAES_3203 [Fibrella aestuarina BUZ 2]|uniref:DUF3127 domain-containing protein n=1 Tax=Fibrella aestuarina BUZ 2 TaxID=1166018 RepID=I0KAQ9_9BACT|nr:DUF3127 domain-containing protein [Fibrella aestuarina]CCH01212.1 hypothetical protein FAES_3203 [Fibrella aestuarina BUZ 2]
MALELVGKLVKTMPEVTGQGKNGAWQKQEFVIETFDQFPKKVCLSLWGDKVNDLKQYAPGDSLKVSLNLESREYNDRWYTEARAWRIEAADAAEGGQPQAQAAPAASRPRAAQPTATPFNASFDDDNSGDLPF